MKNRFFTTNRKLLIFMAIVFTLVLLIQAPLSADAYSHHNLAGKWDRLNPGPSPEHEIFLCGGNASWRCIYEKQPEPTLGFLYPPDTASGKFRGEDITMEWECPGWFPEFICVNTIQVVGGVAIYSYQHDVGEIIIPEELILTEIEGDQVLYLYWVNRFVCPWYRSFDEALAANPFPLPFNGEDWPEMDCFGP